MPVCRWQDRSYDDSLLSKPACRSTKRRELDEDPDYKGDPTRCDFRGRESLCDYFEPIDPNDNTEYDLF